MRSLILCLALVFFITASHAQIRIVEDACPGVLDGATRIFNLGGKIVSFGNQDHTWLKIFRRYDNPLAMPDTLLLPELEKDDWIYDITTEQKQMMFVYYNGFSNNALGNNFTNQFEFRTYSGNHYMANASFDSIHPVSLGQPYTHQFSDIEAAAFHPDSHDLYYLADIQPFDSTGTYVFGIMKRDAISGEQSQILSFVPFIPSGQQSGGIRECLFLRNHIIFYNNYDDNDIYEGRSFYSFNIHTQELNVIVQDVSELNGLFEGMVNGEYAYFSSFNKMLFRFNDLSGIVEQVTPANGFNPMRSDEKFLFPLDHDGAMFFSSINNIYGLCITQPNQGWPKLIYETRSSNTAWAELIPFKNEWYAIVQYEDLTFDLVRFDVEFNATLVLTDEHFEHAQIVTNLVAGKDKFFFDLLYDDVHELAFSDGTASGTDIMYHDGYFFGTDAFDKLSIDSILYFSGVELFRGQELFWVNEKDLRATPKVVDLELLLFPNPAKYSITIQWPISETFDRLKIFDSIGQEVQRYDLSPGENKYTLQLTGLNHGMYTLELIGVKPRRLKLVKD